MAVGQTKACVRETPAQGSQDARLTYAGLAGEQGVAVLLAGVDEIVDNGLA